LQASVIKPFSVCWNSMPASASITFFPDKAIILF
jgi:hypothetical protein